MTIHHGLVFSLWIAIRNDESILVYLVLVGGGGNAHSDELPTLSQSSKSPLEEVWNRSVLLDAGFSCSITVMSDIAEWLIPLQAESDRALSEDG